MPQRIARGFDYFFITASVQRTTIDVSDQANAVTVKALHLSNIDTGLRIQRVQRVGIGFGQLIYDWHDIAVGVLDGIETHIPVTLDQLLQIGRNEFGELKWVEKRTGVETVI